MPEARGGNENVGIGWAHTGGWFWYFALVLWQQCWPPQGGDAPFHHLKNGFRNPPDSPKRDIPFKRRMKFFSEAVWRNAVSKPPTIPTDHALTRDEAKAQLAAMGDDDFVSWIGHATFLVRLDGFNVLTDPVFSRAPAQ